MSGKVIHVIAGANGVGKTSFAWEFLPKVGMNEFLNADLLAAGISPLKPEAGRILLQRWKGFMARGVSFGFESTLSGRIYARMLQQAKTKGYSVSLHYLWVPEVQICLERVAHRVAKGGRNVPELDIRRRFSRSLQSFFVLYLPQANETTLLDVGGRPPKLVAKWHELEKTILQRETYEGIKKQAESEA